MLKHDEKLRQSVFENISLEFEVHPFDLLPHELVLIDFHRLMEHIRHPH